MTSVPKFCVLLGRVGATITSFLYFLRPLVYDGAITIDGGFGQGSFGCKDQNAM